MQGSARGGGTLSPRPSGMSDNMPPDLGQEINDQSAEMKQEDSGDGFDQISDNYNLEGFDSKEGKKDHLDDELDNLF